MCSPNLYVCMLLHNCASPMSICRFENFSKKRSEKVKKKRNNR